MRKILLAGAAATTLIGGTTASVAPASAQNMHMHNGGHYGGHSYGYHGGYYGHGHYYGGALAAGVIGFGLGAALASPYYYDSYPGYYYGPSYYYGPDYGYGYGYGYGTCYSRQWVWSPYAGRYVLQSVPYAC